jgi:hypothetical protein
VDSVEASRNEEFRLPEAVPLRPVATALCGMEARRAAARRDRTAGAWMRDTHAQTVETGAGGSGKTRLALQQRGCRAAPHRPPAGR